MQEHADNDISLETKLEKLKNYITTTGSCMIAFSGGLDSTFLLYVASLVLGKRAVGITALTPYMSTREISEAKEFTIHYKIRHKE